MNKRQAKKKKKKSITYMMISSSKRDRNHRIPKKKAVVLKMGGPCDVVTRNHRIYPESVVREAMRKGNYPKSQVFIPTIQNVNIQVEWTYSATPPFEHIATNKTVSWSIRGIGNHPVK